MSEIERQNLTWGFGVGASAGRLYSAAASGHPISCTGGECLMPALLGGVAGRLISQMGRS